MLVVEHISELRQEIRARRQNDGTESAIRIGFVPTMGYLHEGHASLIREAKKQCDCVVLSIFVNPLQFGPNEDYDRYPRDLKQDLAVAADIGVDIVFTPDVEEMYPTYPQMTTVTISGQMTDKLCGTSRPGHFDGVATVVTKLFQIVQPDLAFFGQKDAQQAAIITRMTADLNMPVRIITCPIVRERDGLAKSSRNVYLNDEERGQATVLYEALQAARHRLDNGQATADELKQIVTETIRQAPLAEIEYVEIVDYPQLNRIEAERIVSGSSSESLLIAIAVRFGRTRLIDNMLVGQDPYLHADEEQY